MNRGRWMLGAGTGMIAACLLAGAARADEAEGEGQARRDEIVVTGLRSVAEASSGTKTDLPLSETPQSISVIDSSEIAGLGLQNLNQALRFVAGVTPETRGSSAEVYDQYKLRGFDAPTFLDGLKQFGSSLGYAVPQVDVSRLDRVEIVKGAASALYGASSPGGFVNLQSKLPLDRDFYGAVSGTYGNYDLYRVDADVGGKTGSVLWRVYGSANGADAQQDYGKRERQTVSGAVTLGAGSSTDFTVLAAYSHDPYNGNYGVFPAVGTLFTNPVGGKLPTSFYGGEPGDFFRREQLAFTYIFNHDFGGGWKFRSSGRYTNVKSDLGIIYTSGPQAAPATDPTRYSRASYATKEELNNWVYDNQLTGSFETGPLQHSVLLGTDRQVSHARELYAFGSATPIDGFDPVYGTMPTPTNPYVVPGYDPVTFGYDPNAYGVPNLDTAQQRQQGIYAQDQISLGGLRVILSGRNDWARQARQSNGGASQVKKDEKFTYRAGALYKTAFGLAPYVSYSTSFEPQAALLVDGTLANPSLGKQFEAGAKYQVPGTDILLTGAYFHIEQTNVVVYNPLNFLATQAGKVRSRGFEVEASGSLPYDFNFRFAFSTQNVKNVQDVDPALVGRGLATVGRGGVSANLAWAPKSGAAEGLTIGGAVRHVRRTYAGLYTQTDGTQVPENTPAYTVFDGLVRYSLAKWGLDGVTIGVNATNILDKKYLTSCFANYSWCWYGNRRTVQGTIGFTW
ncbi:TonB-dependent siderophore receptor [Novosphingobium sp. Leaf2]|uniref:TonB-dependent siderophore receptor n=1 Tax=Novosphingobium sp. Leaf2 TaxID=1735670 RepID=UPI0006F2E708|nr:TonB-dependent siderophore receptor [Novosphingobium sp. Leaf2]KQM22026.1 TonB-dependent receptor [Novosphingobium sp. Leaf2]